MSHFTRGQCAVSDPEALLLALNEVGVALEHIEIHATPQPLYGFEGQERGETANLIVRREHVGYLSNDIGVLMTPNGAEIIVSEYDRRHRYGDAWINKLRQLAGVHMALLTAQRNGQYAERRVDAKGRLQVVVGVA